MADDDNIENELVPSSQFSDVEEIEVTTLSPLMRKMASVAQRAKKRASDAPPIESVPRTDQQQLDLFVADLFDYSLKDDQHSMEAPIFSLSTKPDLELWTWHSQDKKKWLQITPSVKGRATMHDKDLLIYLASQLVAAMNVAARNGTKNPGRRIRFVAHDYLVATRKDIGGKNYSSLEATIERLEGTRLKTNISVGNIDSRSSFGLIESSNYIVETDEHGKKRLTFVEVTLSEWLYQTLEKRTILTISPEYFSLRKPLEKRLFQLARFHVRDQAEWFIEENNLMEKAGSMANIREFRRMVSIIIEADTIPEYRIAPVTKDGKKMYRFYQKDIKKFALAYGKKIGVGKRFTGRYDEQEAERDLLS